MDNKSQMDGWTEADNAISLVAALPISDLCNQREHTETEVEEVIHS